MEHRRVLAQPPGDGRRATTLGPVQVGFLLEQLLAPVPGGTGRYSRDLAAAVAATAPPDSAVTGWTAWHRDPTDARVPGLAGPHRLPLPRRVLAELWRRGRGPAPRAALVHAPTLLLPPRRRGTRLAVTIHDAVPWTHPETLTPRGVAWHRAMGERAAVDADVVLVPTVAVAAELSRHLALRRVEVVGEGVGPEVGVVPEDADVRAARLGLPTEYALVVGTLEPRKGLDVAVAATAARSWPDLPLLAVGPTGWGEVRLPAADPQRLRLLGRLSDADLAVAYARAAAVLVPSRSEGFGLPVLEAMTHGVPVVVSDAPALVEVAGGAAVVVPVGDADALAAGVVEARRRRAELGVAGPRRAAQYTWRDAAERCWDIYRSVL
jgi:glycosyltransferase involved in cell wall biosynthesis